MSKRLMAVVVAFLLCASGTGTANAATWSSSDKWGSWSNGGYTVRNNIWGSGAGSQKISADSYRKWTVTANHPNTGGVKSYPHVAKAVNTRVSSIGSLRSSFSVSVPRSGAYATAYDIWLGNNAYEVMLWMNKTGAVGPIGSKQATASVGGHTWDIYRGSNGGNAVFSFVRTSNTSSGTVDIKSVLTWIKNRGWYGDVTLGEVQFGFEITSSSGGLNFSTNGFSM